MSIQLRNVKGTKDFIPSEQITRQEIIQILQDTFIRYGYLPMETPNVCYFDVLASKYAGGSEILKEVYKLNDQGMRELGLRYDLTVPFARFIGMNPTIKMPFKRYEIGKVYRDGPVKLGRAREFYQCDVDIVGVKSILAEAELMAMAKEVYSQLGLDVYISYNNRKLLTGIIKLSGINDKLVSKTILMLDKMNKIGKYVVRCELSELGIGDVQINELFQYIELSLNEIKEKIPSTKKNSMIVQGLEEIEELNGYLEGMGIEQSMKFTLTLSRGLEIYTGTIWEVFLSDASIASSVGAGGRYDNIIGSFIDNGNEYPAVGMTFGLDVIYEALKLKGEEQYTSPVKLYIVPLGTEKESFELATRLRQNGIAVDIAMQKKKISKALYYADKKKIPYVLILGENEIKSGEVKLKNMIDGSQRDIKIDDIAKYLS
jgi:histidyl-tRNA synthetase